MKLTCRFRAFAFIAFLITTNFSICQISEKDSATIEIEALTKTYKNYEDEEKKDSAQTILKKAYSLQGYLVKEAMKNLLDPVRSNINFDENSRATFLFLLVQSRNHLFYHEYEKALEQGDLALELESYSEKGDLVYLFATIATCFYYQSKYENALESHFESLKICENNPELNCSAGIYNNISTVYMAIEDWDKAEKYIMDALDIATELDNYFEESRAVGNMAIVFTEQGKFDEAEEWFLRDLNKDLEVGDVYSASLNYNNLGSLKERQEKYREALSYYRKSLDMAIALEDNQSIALGYRNLGWMEHKTGNTKRAIEYFGLGIQLMKDLGNKNSLRDAFLNLSEFHRETNEPQKALEYFVQYHDLNDSIVGEERLKAISELEVKFETQQKENELLKLSKQKQEDELVIARQNRRVRQLSFGLGAIALFGILGFVLFRQRLQNKKQQELILAISETQSEERKRIAQDLHDSIGGSLALTKSKFEVAKKSLKTPSTEMDSALETLEQTTQQVRQISHNLMPGELVRFGLVAAINTLLENLNEEEINAQFHSNQGEERLEPLKEIQLYRIVQEALQNVLKHARANNLFIQLNKHQEHLTLMIEDDGKGIVQDSEEGMGLKNIKQRVQLLKGIFTIDSAPERGTILNIQIPV